MGKLKDAVLTAGSAHNHERLTTAPMVDLSYGGQEGYMSNPAEYASNAKYVQRNVIAVLVEAPRGFKDLPNSDKRIETLKALVEEQSTSISGLNSTLSTEWAESRSGGGGEMQEDITNVTRARSTPTHEIPEKYGRPVGTFFEDWITSLLMDPDTKVPNVISMVPEGQVPDLLPDYTGMTVLYFEPDPTHRKVIKAWLCTNMMPKGAGDNTGKRDLGSSGDSPTISVEFTAVTQVGRAVVQFAQETLNSMNLSGVNPNSRPALIDAINPDVTGASSGYIDAIREAEGTFLS